MPRPLLSRFKLYELCVQDPPRMIAFLEAVHGGGANAAPRALREDFCGPAAVARAWAAKSRSRSAIAIDRDPEPPAAAMKSARVKVVIEDVLRSRHQADVIAAMNFAVCELHERATLREYLRGVRASLKRGGVFVCDLYGGADQWTRGEYTKTLRGPGLERITYTWSQREADALTGRVVNSISFMVTPPKLRAGAPRRPPGDPSRRTLNLPDAFVYDWRLWSIAELRDVMTEAGLESEVYDTLGDAIDSEGRLYVRPVSPGDELGDNWVVYVAARPRNPMRRSRVIG